MEIRDSIQVIPMEFTGTMLLEVFQMIERMMIFFVGLVIGYLWGTSQTIKPYEKKEAEQLMGDPAIIAESDDDEEAEHVLGGSHDAEQDATDSLNLAAWKEVPFSPRVFWAKKCNYPTTDQGIVRVMRKGL